MAVVIIISISFTRATLCMGISVIIKTVFNEVVYHSKRHRCVWHWRVPILKFFSSPEI